MERDDRAYTAMIGRADALVPQLRDRAPKTEELRRLPPETERELHESGLFRILQPKRVGAPNSIMSRWSIAPMRSGRATLRWRGTSPIWLATTGCSACSIRARRIWSGTGMPTR